MKRKLAALLALLMLIPTVAACSSDDASDGGNGTPTGTVDTTVAADAETTEAGPTSAVPADLDLDGFVVKVLRTSERMFKPLDDLDSGDIVDAAILNTRDTLCEELNFDFNFFENANNEILDKLQTFVLAGTDDYNIVVAESWRLAQNVTVNYYHNLLDLDYANFEADWWATDWMDESAVGDNARYMAVGDILLTKQQYQSCIYYNKDVYEDYYGDANEMYQKVADGKLVLDDFAEMSQQVYSDLNGNSEKDIEDRYAMVLHTLNLTDHLTYDTGFRATHRDANGVPYLDIVNEKNVAFVEKLYDLFNNNEGTFVVSTSVAGEANSTTIPNKFSANELMFILGWIYTSESLRDMESDYGIIPYPKYDEAQEDYIALCHDSTAAITIPITASLEVANKVSAVIEEMSFLAWRDVTPTYYEIALKVKYVRDSDDLAMQILDTIHAAATTDFAYIYNYALNGVGLIMRDLMGAKNSDLTSYYASKQSAIETKFDELITHFTEMQ